MKMVLFACVFLNFPAIQKREKEICEVEKQQTLEVACLFLVHRADDEPSVCLRFFLPSFLLKAIPGMGLERWSSR